MGEQTRSCPLYTLGCFTGVVLDASSYAGHVHSSSKVWFHGPTLTFGCAHSCTILNAVAHKTPNSEFGKSFTTFQTVACTFEVPWPPSPISVVLTIVANLVAGDHIVSIEALLILLPVVAVGSLPVALVVTFFAAYCPWILGFNRIILALVVLGYNATCVIDFSVRIFVSHESFCARPVADSSAILDASTPLAHFKLSICWYAISIVSE